MIEASSESSQNPAFSHANIREFHEVFLDKAIQVRASAINNEPF